MVAMLSVASGRGSHLKMIIIWIHNTSLCGGEYLLQVKYYAKAANYRDF